MKLYEVIDQVLRCERRIRQIYLTLSERADFPHEMRVFWHGSIRSFLRKPPIPSEISQAYPSLNRATRHWHTGWHV